jgi:AcrR family transcriptional regulator
MASEHASPGPEGRRDTAGARSAGGSSREAIVDATMRLLGHREFTDVTISDIAREAGVSLADFRDCFPSKGAVLAAFSRRIDRKVLESPIGISMAGPARDRLYEVLRRRLEALEPYRSALASIARWEASEPWNAAALNREIVNSMRFMLEAADIDSEGALGALKLQGLALAWGRVLGVWLNQRGHDLSRALSALDRELDRGEKFVGQAEEIARFAEPFTSFASRLWKGRHRRRHRRHRHHGESTTDLDSESGHRHKGRPAPDDVIET